jgi:hypothetical protein
MSVMTAGNHPSYPTMDPQQPPQAGTIPMAVAQPVNQPMAIAQPVGQPMAVAQPAQGYAVGQPAQGYGQPAPEYGQPAPVYPVGQPNPMLMERGQQEVEAFGFVLFERERRHPTNNLAGLYISCSAGVPCCCIPLGCSGVPLPLVACRKFSAIDDHTLENDCSCYLCLMPLSEKGTDRHYKRDPDVLPPNSFSNAQGGTIEFGGCNGLCAASTKFTTCLFDVCYLRIC